MKIKRVGLIRCGAIGRPVARALMAGKAGSHSLLRRETAGIVVG